MAPPIIPEQDQAYQQYSPRYNQQGWGPMNLNDKLPIFSIDFQNESSVITNPLEWCVLQELRQ